MAVDWGAAAAWGLRDPEFGELRANREGELVVAMEYEWAGPRWPELCAAWLDLGQRSILDALSFHEHRLLLRYAALNWKHPTLQVGNRARAKQTAAIWIIDLVDAYRAVGEAVGNDIDLFWNPQIHIDLDERPRLSFRAQPLPEDQLPPELQRKNPRWDERTLVFQIGRLMRQLATFDAKSDAHELIAKCVDEKPSNRWKSLDELVKRAEKLGVVAKIVREYEELAIFRAFEEGLGWLELGEDERALEQFTRATRFTPPARIEKLSSYVQMHEEGAKVARERIEAAKRRAALSGTTNDGGTIIIDDPALAKSRTATCTIVVRELERRSA
ncbi:MAG TPA: hypothetical protein VLB44_22625, partial [Kofleriaceae bacterium]|nr:hypothetical protein [Kofleriaceae bacterium]